MLLSASLYRNILRRGVHLCDDVRWRDGRQLLGLAYQRYIVDAFGDDLHIHTGGRVHHADIAHRDGARLAVAAGIKSNCGLLHVIHIHKSFAQLDLQCLGLAQLDPRQVDEARVHAFDAVHRIRRTGDADGRRGDAGVQLGGVVSCRHIAELKLQRHLLQLQYRDRHLHLFTLQHRDAAVCDGMAVRVQKFQRRTVQHRAVALFIALHAGHHPRHARQFVHRPAQRHLGGGGLLFAQIIPLGRVHAGFHFHGEFLRADLRKRHVHICGRDGVDIKFCQRRIRAARLQPQRVFAGHA